MQPGHALFIKVIKAHLVLSGPEPHHPSLCACSTPPRRAQGGQRGNDQQAADGRVPARRAALGHDGCARAPHLVPASCVCCGLLGATYPLPRHNVSTCLQITGKVLHNRLLAGTPTPNTPDASVDKLQPLLAFLQHQPYGSEPESWKRAVQVRCTFCWGLQL